MAILGFNLILKDYCSYCSEFEPEIVKCGTSFLGEGYRCDTNIYCKHRNKCEAIAKNVERRMADDRI